MEYTHKIEAYILDAIDASGYGRDLKGKTPAEKLQFVRDTFKAEYGWAVSRYGKQGAIREWLAGLPSAINIEWRNCEILELGKVWGELPADASTAREDAYLNRWFGSMAFRLIQTARKYGVEFPTA